MPNSLSDQFRKSGSAAADRAWNATAPQRSPGRTGTLAVFSGELKEGDQVAEVQAYILIQTEVGKAAQVASSVRDIDGVDAAEDVTGPYDVIVRASAGNVDDLGKLVVAKIQAVEGITRTLTCPVVHL
jgi:DNA-binding Lrp family transcriptional regulator